MKSHINLFRPEDSLPALKDILLSQGILSREHISEKASLDLKKARKIFLKYCRPAAVFNSIEKETVLRALNHQNVNEALILRIIPRADRTIAFVLTLGRDIDDAIHGLFEEKDLAVACFLDSYSSLGISTLMKKIEGDFTREEAVCLAYCPGYCGWDLGFQRVLLEFAGASSIGVRLNESSMMIPLKSISGILAFGVKDIHKFENDFSFCAECADHFCQKRMTDL